MRKAGFAVLALPFVIAACGSDSDDDPIDPDPDGGVVDIETDPFRDLPTGQDQWEALCAKGYNDTVTEAFCAGSAPAADHLVRRAAQLPRPDRRRHRPGLEPPGYRGVSLDRGQRQVGDTAQPADVLHADDRRQHQPDQPAARPELQHHRLRPRRQLRRAGVQGPDHRRAQVLSVQVHPGVRAHPGRLQQRRHADAEHRVRLGRLHPVRRRDDRQHGVRLHPLPHRFERSKDLAHAAAAQPVDPLVLPRGRQEHRRDRGVRGGPLGHPLRRLPGRHLPQLAAEQPPAADPEQRPAQPAQRVRLRRDRDRAEPERLEHDVERSVRRGRRRPGDPGPLLRQPAVRRKLGLLDAVSAVDRSQ